MSRCPLWLAVPAIAVAAACTGDAERDLDDPRACDSPGVRAVVRRFGERMKLVSLQAPDTSRVRQIREAYAGIVTDALMETWIADPAGAPGRLVSSPWPERIEIDSVRYGSERSCVVDATLVYLTSAERSPGDAAARERVTLGVRRDRQWRVSAYRAHVGATPDSTDGSAGAADVRRRSFDGSYTIRRSVVDGASPQSRDWHIQSARLTRAP